MRVEVPFFRRLLIAIVCLVSFVEMSAQIEINNETQLRAIANDLAGDYELTSDITTVQRNYPIDSVDLNRNHSSDVLVL